MDKKMEDKTLTITNQMDELAIVVDYLDSLGEEWELSPALVFSLNLVLEEALTNTILYGFDEDDHQHNIAINFTKKGDEVAIMIVDDGREYDPTLKADPDITLPVEERPIGGLGIFLIKKIMDQVEYVRKDNRNFLMLTKNICV
jgi:serine/threonine-protein kinase RsbW